MLTAMCSHTTNNQLCSLFLLALTVSVDDEVSVVAHSGARDLTTNLMSFNMQYFVYSDLMASFVYDNHDN